MMNERELAFMVFGLSAGLLIVLGLRWLRRWKERKRLLAGGEWGQGEGVPYGGEPEKTEPEPTMSLADTIVKSLQERPQDWKFCDCTAIHMPSKRCLWISKGADYCTGYDELFGAPSIGFIQPEDRDKVWEAAKEAQKENGRRAEAKAAKRLM